MIGQMLGNRYEIIEKIGTGGMSVVYKAKCHLLNRFVAIKILRQEFTDNADFVKRFKVEAQAAASLSHPNIVSVYDVGNQEDLYYIVMEYVDGITLKDYILENKIIPWKEAVGIAIQICSALEHAHKNGIVHRDIKPHNIMITKDGVAKVTDFGIARAATYYTVTYAGNAIGSVHYFSPEQARGGYTDNKSDIYSLGIVMYEMLTGNVPFSGDSPVTIAFKHLEDIPVPPIELNSDIPTSLNSIVLKAMAKDINSRYSSATELLTDLNESMKYPDYDFVVSNPKDDKESPTVVMPAVNSNMKDGKSDLPMKANSKPKDKPKTKSDKATLYSALITSLLIVGFIGFFAYKFIFSYPHSADQVAVPNLIGKTEDDAAQILSKNNLVMKVKDRRNDDKAPSGEIIDQSPSSGTAVRIPSAVEVVVSAGKSDITIPSVANEDYRIAQLTLEKLGMMVEIVHEPSDTVPVGFVTKTEPSVDSSVKAGSKLSLYVSSGPDKVSFPMPNLVGMTWDDAKKVLDDKKLDYSVPEYKKSTKPEGTVITQDVEPNSVVYEGNKVNVVLSSGNKSIRFISLNLPQDKSSVRVKVVLIDNTGDSSVVYDKKQLTSASPLTIKLSGEGKMHLQVYFNDVLDSEDDIFFDEVGR